MNKATEKHGIYCLAEAMQPGTYLLTKKPINNLDDLKNMKIRAPGAYGKMLRQLGASPVVIAFAEVYTSLATGVVDGVDGCNLVDHRDGKFYEVAKYMYPLPLTGAQVSPLIVNLKAYNSLPEDLKEILKAASYYHGFLSAYKSVVWEKEALQEMINKGLKMSPPPSEADKKKWQEAGIAIWPEYEAADATSKQMIEAQRVFMKKMGK
jgi:TRAP-type C4-dicarboxylate transport system substrate-binding protein